MKDVKAFAREEVCLVTVTRELRTKGVTPGTFGTETTLGVEGQTRIQS